MRKIRGLVIVFFIASCVCFGAYIGLKWLHTDLNEPEIHFDDEKLSVSASAKEDALMAGVTAKDKEDGDLTDRIQVASMSPLLANNERTIEYVVFDDANNFATATRTVVYKDYVPPRIYVKEPLRFTLNNYEGRLENLEMEAVDMIDGDVTNRVRKSWGETSYLENTGNYKYIFQVNNSAGDSCIVPVEITIVDSANENGKYYPILNEYIVYTSVGKELDMDEYLEGIQGGNETYMFDSYDNPEGVSADSVTIRSYVNYEKPGVYKVIYAYMSSDYVVAETTLYVVVEE